MSSSYRDRGVTAMHHSSAGFTLIETVIGVAIFLLVSISVYGGFLKALDGVAVLRTKSAAVNLANEQIEIVRNLPYDDVGIVGGIPAGKIVRNQTIIRGGITFHVNTSVRSIDDPFDGQIGEVPNDLSPGDYKLVEITLTCDSCKIPDELKFYARVSPLALETTGNNGALFVQVFDSTGQPIQGADVHIENNQGTSTIVIDEVTNNDGMFQIVDAPPGTEAYEITVSKGSTYSTDRTYTIGAPENPLPDKPHANVAAGAVTQVSFTIDELSDLGIYTRDVTCGRIPNVDLAIRGSKTIGSGIYKFDEIIQTSASGFIELPNIEWDNYFLSVTDTSFDLAGSNPFLPLEVNPGTSQVVDIILAPHDPNALLVKVIDGETGLPVSDAVVTLDNGSNEYELTTGRGSRKQTDWSGGDGQEYFSAEDQYYSSADVDVSGVVGQVTLDTVGSEYAMTGQLESSIFDMGTTTNFGTLFWNPVDQPVLAGSDSVRMQLASNLEVTATSTWNFIGPDGTDTSFYTSSGESIAVSHNGDRYIKYKLFLQTDDVSVTPIIANVSFTYTFECFPPGQVFFNNIPAGQYTLSVDHPDYAPVSESNFTISSDWAEHEVLLTP